MENFSEIETFSGDINCVLYRLGLLLKEEFKRLPPEKRKIKFTFDTLSDIFQLDINI